MRCRTCIPPYRCLACRADRGSWANYGCQRFGRGDPRLRRSWTEGPAAPPGARSRTGQRDSAAEGHQAIQMLPNALREDKGIRVLEEALQGRHLGGVDGGARPDPRKRRLGRIVPPEQP